MPKKKETTRTTEKKTGVKVQDLATKKDPKGGPRLWPGGPRPVRDGIKNP